MPKPKRSGDPLPPAVIERKIYLLRRQKVMLDSDLAALYGVETFNLNKAVKRNLDRFPSDFMFQLTPAEARALRFQIGISSEGAHGGRRYLPYVFTQEGVAMLSSVLRSPRAVKVNIAIMRAFVRLREILATNRQLAAKVEEMERRYDAHFKAIFEVIQALMAEPEESARGEMGFRVGKDG
ncbi:MAG: ORF6N domain-containing protein [Thermoanaerobaculia bacterium]